MPYINIKSIIINSTIKVNNLCNKQVSYSASPKQKSDCKPFQCSSLRASYSRDRIYQCSKYLFPAIRHKSRYTAEWRPLLPALYGILRHRLQPASRFCRQSADRRQTVIFCKRADVVDVDFHILLLPFIHGPNPYFYYLL